jgi:hypothetical protein
VLLPHTLNCVKNVTYPAATCAYGLSATLACRSIDLRFVCRFVLGLNTGRRTPYCAGASWPGVGQFSGMFRGVEGASGRRRYVSSSPHPAGPHHDRPYWSCPKPAPNPEPPLGVSLVPYVA